MTTPRRQPPAQHVLAVESTEWLTPHLVRVVVTGESLAGFTDNGYTDAYVKLVFVDPALGIEPPYDMAALRAGDQRPVVRTYTVRWVDRAARRLAIDFVTHGDTGVAAVWAAKAAPGDRLVLSGPGGAYAPDPAAARHLFAGDLSAVPAIAAALEALPADARGVAYLEVADPADVLELKHPDQVAVHWLVNTDPDDVALLARALDGEDWPLAGKEQPLAGKEQPSAGKEQPLAGDVRVFAHGERESVKAIRAVLRDRGLPHDSISISGYWARGRTEDVFQAEKRESIGRID